MPDGGGVVSQYAAGTLRVPLTPPHHHPLRVCHGPQVVNLFNMFITYGDSFLPTPSSYDALYYEIVRMHQVFDNLYCMGRWMTSSSKT